ncbi:MAG: Ig-like domain-containing protein [Bacteroidales bacterium]|nr:Ig-like domain-containing protein [Bacteroidales bacterium]
MKHILTIAIILSLVLVTSSCREDNGLAVSNLTLNHTEALIALGWSLELTTSVTPHFATHQMITWSSSDTSIATVNNYGLVIASSYNEGDVVITARIAHSGFEAHSAISVFRMVPPTVETIETYVGYPFVDAVANFLNNGSAIYDITLMSPRLDALREAYRAAFPWGTTSPAQFSRFSLVMPPTFSAGSPRTLALQIHYTGTSGIWPFRTWDPDVPALTRIDTLESNPNSDAVFGELFRVDRTATAPHSTTPTGANPFGVPSGSAIHNAILGIYTFIEGSGTSAQTKAAPDEGDTRNFIGFLNSPKGFRIFQDGNNFWFRSLADPTDWFKAERQ